MSGQERERDGERKRRRERERGENMVRERENLSQVRGKTFAEKRRDW